MTRSGRVASATIVALLLVLAAGLAAVEIVTALLGHRDWLNTRPLTRWAASTSWDDSGWRAASAAVAACGTALLLLAVLPGRRRTLRLGNDADNVDAVTTRRSVRHLAAVAADRVDGVESATARLRRRTLRVTASTRLAEPATLANSIRSAVEDRVRALELQQPLHVATRIRRARREVR